jgi:hypothetical protein
VHLYLGLNVYVLQKIDADVEFTDCLLVVPHQESPQLDLAIAFLQLLLELFQIEVRHEQGLLIIKASKPAVINRAAGYNLQVLNFFVTFWMIKIKTELY